MAAMFRKFEEHVGVYGLIRITIFTEKGIIFGINDQRWCCNGIEKMNSATAIVVVDGTRKAVQWSGVFIIKFNEGVYAIQVCSV